MKTIIIDNWLSKDFQLYINNLFLYYTPHWWGHKSSFTQKNAKTFYSCKLNIEDSLYSFLGQKALDTIRKGTLKRMYINIQHPGMDSSYHTDDGNITAIYMATKTLPKGGAFIIKGEKEIPFVQGRFIAFDATKLHKAKAPLKGEARITLAFKTI